MSRIIPGAALLALTLGLAGCSANDTEQSSSRVEATQQDLLDAYGLDGLDAVEVVERLDRLAVSERPADLMASVTPDHLVLTSPETELAMPLPEDSFYLSIAPYVEQTHECHFHSLTTCLGELSNEPVHVEIVDSAGEVLVDEQTTTFDNGFVGVWVPSDTEGTIEITFDGMTGTTEFTTTGDAATCITDLQLV